MDKIGPATPKQALAYMYVHGHQTGIDREVIIEFKQQSYVDETRVKRRVRMEPAMTAAQAQEEDEELKGAAHTDKTRGTAAYRWRST